MDRQEPRTSQAPCTSRGAQGPCGGTTQAAAAVEGGGLVRSLTGLNTAPGLGAQYSHRRAMFARAGTAAEAGQGESSFDESAFPHLTVARDDRRERLGATNQWCHDACFGAVVASRNVSDAIDLLAHGKPLTHHIDTKGSLRP